MLQQAVKLVPPAGNSVPPWRLGNQTTTFYIPPPCEVNSSLSLPLFLTLPLSYSRKLKNISPLGHTTVLETHLMSQHVWATPGASTKSKSQARRRHPSTLIEEPPSKKIKVKGHDKAEETEQDISKRIQSQSS